MTVVDDQSRHHVPGSTDAGWTRRLMTSERATPRRAFWWAFAAFFAVTALWALSNPLMATVDEPAHVVKAAATVYGAEDISPDGNTTGVGTVELPRLYGQLAHYANCFAFQPNESVACQQDLSSDTESLVEVKTSAVNYNPLYYALVGWPALLPDGEHTVYAMRLATALLSSALLALTVSVVAGLRERRWVGIAVLTCMTPTFVNLLSAVNPQSVELAGAVLLWVSLLALLHSPDPAALPLRLSGVVAGALFVANARGLGPGLVVVVLGVCVLSAPWRRTFDLVADRRTWWALGASIVACALGTAWILTADSLPAGSGQVGIPLFNNVIHTLGITSAYAEQMFVALGWLDFGAPKWLIFLLVAGVGAVVLVGWAAADGRVRFAVALTAAGTFAMPIAAHVVQADKIGFFWQGRYALPIAVGIVLLSGLAISRRDHELPSWLSLNLVTALSAIVVVGHTVMFYATLHRYSVGFDGGWVLDEPLPWLPVPAAVLTLLYAAAWVGVAVAVGRASLSSSPHPGVVPSRGDDAATAGPGTTRG
jgi:hypothetical protein